jgi:hypothetical protein
MSFRSHSRYVIVTIDTRFHPLLRSFLTSKRSFQETVKVFYFWMCSCYVILGIYKQLSFSHLLAAIRFVNSQAWYNFSIVVSNIHDVSPARTHCYPSSAHQVRTTDDRLHQDPELTKHIALPMLQPAHAAQSQSPTPRPAVVWL